MNVRPGGKQSKMCDTVWEGCVQKMVDENGIPMGMKMILYRGERSKYDAHEHNGHEGVAKNISKLH